MKTVFQDQLDRKRNIIIALAILVIVAACLLLLQFMNIAPKENTSQPSSRATELKAAAAQKENANDLDGAVKLYSDIKDNAKKQNDEEARLDAEAKIQQIEKEKTSQQQSAEENEQLQAQAARDAGAENLED